MSLYNIFISENKQNWSSRSTRLDEEEFINMVKTQCKDWLSNPIPLTRFKDNVSSEFSYMDPGKYNRDSYLQKYSTETTNYTNFIIDQFPSWEGFPKRSKSIIFSHNMEKSFGVFGDELYLVIPFDNSKFGISPSFDLWDSYNNMIKFDDGYINLGGRTNISMELIKLGAPIEYDKFKSWIDDISPDEIRNKSTKFYEIYLEYEKDKMDLLFSEWLNIIFGPSKWYGGENEGSTFEYVNYGELLNINGERECWTDGECLLYHVGNTAKYKDVDYRIYLDKLLKIFK